MSKAAPIGKSFFRDAAEAAPSPLRSVPLTSPTPPTPPAAKPQAAKPKPAAGSKPAKVDAGPMVVVSFRAPESWRDDLAEYAASFRPKRKAQDILIEGVALYRAKYDSRR